MWTSDVFGSGDVSGSSNIKQMFLKATDSLEKKTDHLHMLINEIMYVNLK